MVKILINDSGLYGLWMINALINSNIKFKVEFLSDDKILDLKNTKALFVPGGWAENKIENLSEKSKETLRKFIENGGIYFGICGGARLASKGFLD
ncbi:MAG: BPL-N domain-containing protein, partial [Fervidobacterium sp.]